MGKQEEWLVNFGLRLRIEREKQGMTLKTLANKANTRATYLAEIERAERNPTLRTLLNIFSALDVSADYLIYGTEQIAGVTPGIISNFISFLSRRNNEQISDYYQIIRFLSKYVEQP